MVEPVSKSARLRNVLLLRGTLIIAVGALLLAPSRPRVGMGGLTLVSVFAVSNIVLFALRSRLLAWPRFDVVIGATDLAVVAFGIVLAGAGKTALPISSLLMLLIVALGHSRGHVVAGAAAIGAFHSWILLGRNMNDGLVWQLGLQVMFLCAVALYYGYLAGGIHLMREKDKVEMLGRQELHTLLEILDAINSSSDLQCVVRTIVSKISGIVPALRCSMLFLNEDETRCYVMASHDDPNLEMLEIHLEKYPEVRQAIETRNPVLIDNPSNDPVMAEVKYAIEQLDLQSIMVVPLTAEDGILGTLCLKISRKDHRFSEREVNFCTAVARAAANAMMISWRQHRTGKKLTSILDHSPDLILTTDNEGRITEFNRGAQFLLGYAKNDLLHQPCETIFNDDVEPGLVRRILREGLISNYGCRMKKKGGGELALELNMSVLRQETGRIEGTVWVGRDVTELKAAQMRLLQAEKLSSIGEVISGVAHELNNPLSGVLGYSQLLMMRHSDGPMVRELEKINSSALRCQKIVRNLLSFSRRHKPEQKFLGVNGIIQKTLELRRYQLEANGIEICCELDPELPCTMLDFHQMQQVLLNLINNAEQAMVPGARRGRLVVKTGVHEGMIRVEVIDNGEGMDEERLKRVFDPFFTTKEQGKGTGLGLSVSYGIVKEHGGRIYASSEPGVETTFYIELPVRQRPEGGTSTEGAAEQSFGNARPTSGGRILTVDDEPVIVDLMVSSLEEFGFSVDTAADGAEASRKIRAEDYDAVITDIRMPHMNGMELYREILAIRPELRDRIIFITGDLMDPETMRFLAETNAPTIPKPLEITDLMTAVRKTLDDGKKLPAGSA